MAVPVMLPESEVSRIIRLSRNAQFARAYLEKGIRVPSFPEILSAYSGIRDPAELQERLSVRLRGMLGEPNDASIRRKVATWFARKTASDNREQLVRIVFALEMTEEQAQNFLASAGGGCLHQRNPIELAYLYALRNRLSYTKRPASFESLAAGLYYVPPASPERPKEKPAAPVRPVQRDEDVAAALLAARRAARLAEKLRRGSGAPILNELDRISRLSRLDEQAENLNRLLAEGRPWFRVLTRLMKRK